MVTIRLNGINFGWVRKLPVLVFCYTRRELQNGAVSGLRSFLYGEVIRATQGEPTYRVLSTEAEG